MKILIPFLIAVFIHIAFIFAGNKIYKPAEVYFEPGESAIEMKLVSSIASPQTKTPLIPESEIIKETVETHKPEITEEIVEAEEPEEIVETEEPETTDEIVETEDLEENVVEKDPKLQPEEPEEPEEPEVKTETEPVVLEEEINEEQKSLLKADTDPVIVEEEINIEQELILKEDKEPVKETIKEEVVKQQNLEEKPKKPILDNKISKNDKETKVNKNVLEKKELLEEQIEADTDSTPSTEIVADTLDKGISAPKATGVKRPKYPYSCRKKGHEGVSVLEVVIDAQGNCVDIKIVKSAGCIKLDESAKKVLKKAKFIPAEQFGIKVTGSKKMAFRFRIKDLE